MGCWLLVWVCWLFWVAVGGCRRGGGHGLGAEDAWIAGLRFGFGVAGMICELYGG
jgi:hypothetical protein